MAENAALPSLSELVVDVQGLLWDNETIVVGMLPTLRDVFEVPAALEMTNRVLEKLYDNDHIDLQTPNLPDEVMRPENDINEVIATFMDVRPDVMLAMPANYGHEGHTADICRKLFGAYRMPVYTYAPFDGPPREDGTRPMSV